MQKWSGQVEWGAMNPLYTLKEKEALENFGQSGIYSVLGYSSCGEQGWMKQADPRGDSERVPRAIGEAYGSELLQRMDRGGHGSVLFV